MKKSYLENINKQMIENNGKMGVYSLHTKKGLRAFKVVQYQCVASGFFDTSRGMKKIIKRFS